MLKASVPKHALFAGVSGTRTSVPSSARNQRPPSAKTAITAIFEGKMGNLTLNLSSSDLAFDTTVRVFA